MIKEPYNPAMYRHQVEQMIKDNDIKDLDAFLSFLFTEGWNSQYVIRNRYQKPPETKFIHRFNALWVYPFFLITIPFRYLIYGHIDLSKDSKLGRLILKLIGNY